LRRHRVAVVPRGGGTSRTGQTVNHALVLDFSRHMDQMLEVDAEELWARVQPGLVQDNLNDQVRSLGLQFGPDTSTSNRATLGGMLGNNSGGSHSIAYGLTVDRSEEHTSELQSRSDLVCRLLLEKKKKTAKIAEEEHQHQAGQQCAEQLIP